MKQGYAEYNHGRWIFICPACQEVGILSAMEVHPGEPVICAEEHPDILAKTLVPNPRVHGAFNSVPDEPLREEARRKAIEAGDAYEVIFPRDHEKIEQVLRLRPVAARNWWPGVKLQDLKRENVERGVAHA